MKPWREVIVPRKEILSGTLDMSLFAADLSSVISGRAPSEYSDPATYFQNTYLTAGLRKLLVAVCHRLSSTGFGEPVIQLQTPFGGGKTHSLLALYHLFRAPETVWHLDEVRQPLQSEGIEEIPRARVVTFIGTEADPLQGRTPWGEIAHQLNRYNLVEQHDRKRTTPGKEVLSRVLEGDEPILILMDEVAEYAGKAQDFREQVMSFCQEISELVASVPGTALVVTLPSSVPYGEQADQALASLHTIFGRVEAVYTPVEGEEVYEVIRRRLFTKLFNQEEAKRTAQAYWKMYRQQSADLPQEVEEPSYRDRIVKAYPFHPLLIDTLYERWGTYSTFQRTRGALRLLALVVADLWAQNHSAPLIQPSHLNLQNTNIRNELVSYVGTRYEPVISADIAGPNAHARHVDASLGSEYQKMRPATALTNAIFFGSFSASLNNVGVNLPWLRLATLEPDMSPAIIGDTLKRLEATLWYLHFETGFYAFRVRANINQVLVAQEGTVTDEQIQEHLHRQLNALAEGEWQVRLFPADTQDVPDNKQMKLVVLSLKYTRQSGTTEQFLDLLFTRCGGSFRVYGNTLLALVADDNEVARLRTSLKSLIALQNIDQSPSLLSSLHEDVKSEVKQRLKRAQEDVKHQTVQAYRFVAKPSVSGIQWFNLGIPTIAQTQNIVKRVREHLLGEEVLAENIAPKYLLEQTVPTNETEKAVSAICEAFLRYKNLPMVDKLDTVREALRKGATQKVFSLRDGDTYYCGDNVPYQISDDWVLSREIPQPPAALTAEEVAQLVTSEQTPVKQVYDDLYQRRGSAFPSEEAFRQAFVEAVNQGVRQGLFTIPSVGVRETLTWTELQNRSLQPPPVLIVPDEPIQRKSLNLRAKISESNLSDVMSYIIRPLKELGGTVDLQISLRITTEQSIPESTVASIDETLSQIQAQVVEKRWE